MLLETWVQIELDFAGGDAQADAVRQVKDRMPIKVKKRRALANMDQEEDPELAAPAEGEDVAMTGWEEFYDYVFPEDEASGQGKSAKNLKLLELAHKWKKSGGA